MAGGLFWGIKLGTGISLVAILPMFLTITFREYTPQQQSLETAGVRVSGKVVKKDVRKVPGSPPGGGFGAAGVSRVGGAVSSFQAGARLAQMFNRSKGGPADPRDMVDEYSIRYAFQTPAGQTFEGRQLLDQSQYQWLSTGSSVRVLYLPADPKINRALDYSIPFISSSKPKSFLIGFVSMLLGGFLIRSAWRESTGYVPPPKNTKSDPMDGRMARMTRAGRAHA